MAAWSSRERALVVLGVATALGVAGYLYVAEPLIGWRRELREIIPAREGTLERRRLLIGQRERVRAQLDTATRQFEEETTRLLPGPTAPLAAAALQKLVRDVAAGANVEVRSQRVLPPADLVGLQEVPIELTVSGRIRETVTLLRRLEQAPKLLTIRELKIRLVSAGQSPELLSTLTVAGYLVPGAPAAQPDLPAIPSGPTSGKGRPDRADND
jgi:Tfp pilus assembly protein PilO